MPSVTATPDVSQASITTLGLTGFVVAAAAPLAFVVGAVPLIIGRGGPGAATGLILAGVLVGVFIVGYTRMARHVASPGGLYSFVQAGLGRTAGAGAAFAALLLYATIATAVLGVLAVLTQGVIEQTTGVQVNAYLLGFALAALIGFLGRRSIDVSARMIATIVGFEVILLTAFIVAVGVRSGSDGITVLPFAPGVMGDSQISVMVAVGLTAFVGVEATVVYANELRDPERSIPRAAYGALAILVTLLAGSAWAILAVFGIDGAMTAAATDPVGMVLTAFNSSLGAWSVDVVQVLATISWFVTALAFHNTTSRYLAAMGDERLLPGWLGRRDQVSGAPRNASASHTAFTVIILAIFALTQADPYLDLYVIGAGPSVVGIPLLQALASAAVVAFFWRRGADSPWPQLIAPAVAALGLAGLAALLMTEMEIFTQQTGWINAAIPLAVFAAAAIGCVRGVTMGDSDER